jgi:hypothetical protein
MDRWLKDFAFRIDIGIWTFVLSDVLALVIAFLTVSYKTIKAAMVNPVDSLRYERVFIAETQIRIIEQKPNLLKPNTSL